MIGDSGANNSSGIGAIVTFEVDEPGFSFTRVFMVDGGSGRGGQSPRSLICGVGSWGGSVDAIVRWPGGHIDTLAVHNNTIESFFDETNPQVSNPEVTVQMIPNQRLNWNLSWQTDVSCDPIKDCVLIEGPNGLTKTYWAGGTGVSSSVDAKPGGGYLHRFSFDEDCVSGSYRFTLYSMTQTQPGSTKEVRTSVRFCIQ